MQWLPRFKCYNRVNDPAVAEKTRFQANRSWITCLSEWALEPAAGNFTSLFTGLAYQPGLNKAGNAAHIVVYDRKKQILEEEVISPVVLLAMRNMYQSPLGFLMKATGVFSHLKVRARDPASQKLKLQVLSWVRRSESTCAATW
jgi:hypothetical protein